MSLRIKEVIKEKGLTIQQVANQMGINRVGLSNHINGNPSVEVLQRIADAIGVSVSELFDKPAKDEVKISCPHCGKDINIKVE
jgi:transcriptional regulator with XRE-family HTH domain